VSLVLDQILIHTPFWYMGSDVMCQEKMEAVMPYMFMEMIEKLFLPQKSTFGILYSGLIQDDMLQNW
jgi:hypothetical protein